MSLTLTSQQLELQNSYRTFLAGEWESTKRRKVLPAVNQDRSSQLKLIQEFGICDLFSLEAGEDRLTLKELGLFAFETGFGLPTISPHLIAFFSSYLPTQLGDFSASFVKAFDAPVFERAAHAAPPAACALATFTNAASVTERSQGGNLRVDVCLPLVIEGKGAELVYFKGKGSEGESWYAARLSGGKEQRIETKVLNVIDLLQPYHELTLLNVHAQRLPTAVSASLSLELQVLWAQELSGIAAAVVALTSEYVKTRTQFGKQIGSFQAVQHTLSDMYSRAEASRSLSQFAAWSLAAKQDQGELAGRAALAFATKEVPAIVESAIQLHGGIGFTWEHDLHLYLRRAQFLSLLAQVDEAATAAFLETAQRS